MGLGLFKQIQSDDLERAGFERERGTDLERGEVEVVTDLERREFERERGNNLEREEVGLERGWEVFLEAAAWAAAISAFALRIIGSLCFCQ